MGNQPFMPPPFLERTARIAALLAALLGAAVLAGWAFGISALKSVFPGYAAMQPNAAMLFVVAGVAARLLASQRTGRRARLAAKALGALVAVVAVGTLVEYFGGLDLGIGGALFRNAVRATSPSHPGRMAPASALAFAFLGCSLLVHDVETRGSGRPSQVLALTATLVPLQAFIVYAYGVEPLSRVASYTQLPLHAGVGFALLSAALVLDRPGAGFVRVFSEPGLAGFMARRLGIAIFLLPIVLGWLFVVAGLRYGQYEALLGASFLVISAIIIGGAVVWWNAVALDEAESERARAQETEREQRERLRTTVASIGDGVIATDVLARVTLLNAVAESLTGWSEAEAKGRSLGEVFLAFDEASRERLEPPTDRVFQELDVVPLPQRALLASRDGREHPVEGSAAPIQDDSGVTRGAVIVFRDITERRRMEEERGKLLASEQAARTDAERASRAKDEFIATVSHELRTPLNGVLGWARLLRSGKLDKDATARAVEAIERNATTQAQIVDDLLDVSRIVRGQLRLDVRAIELTPIIEAAIDTVRPAAQARNIIVAAVLSPRAGPVSGDAGRLQQVVWNLLSNAIKFTPPGGRVEVLLERGEEGVRIEVKDTGVGIDPAFASHLFERFRQADSSSTRAHGGLGIGLAIVRHLVEAHGGTVSAKSEGLGKGAIFTVGLPVPSRRPRLPLPEVVRPPAFAEEALRPAPSLSALRVLIVDDDADTLEVVKELLEQAGAQVTAAASAMEALEALRAQPPDVLVSDIGMPGEDGYSLIRRIRSLDPARGGRVPAAALTAYTQVEDRRQVLLAGYQEYLPKPIDPSELTAAVARLAGRLV